MRVDEGVVPGTGGDAPPANDPSQSAGTKNTDGGSGTSDAVPYARFKEVNDRLRAFLDLGDYESLAKLVAWEDDYRRNPVNNWLSIASAMTNDLPPVIVQALERVRAGRPERLAVGRERPRDDDDDGDDDMDGDAPPAWAEDLRDEVRAVRTSREQEAAERRAAEEARETEARLKRIVARWREADKTEQVYADPDRETPEDTIYRQVAMYSGGSRSEEQIFERARTGWKEDGKIWMDSNVKPPPRGETPRTVPGSTPPAGTEVAKPRTLEEAAALAVALDAEGKLV